MVIYPISSRDHEGLALVNWIAEVTVDNASGWQQEGWFRPVSLDSFRHHFDAFRYDWLDVPSMLDQADCYYENPMIDRDPVEYWSDGAVVLIGDAAHAMYPTGSNGASQAIVDARVLGAKMLEFGVTPEALKAFDEELCGPISDLVLRNRGEGPFGLLTLLNERTNGRLDNIDDVIPANERDDFMATYKQAAGFAKDTLNNAPSTIPKAHRINS